MIKLYPSNWLYNAGVVGFLNCLDSEKILEEEGREIPKYKFEDGAVLINPEVFKYIKIEGYLDRSKCVNLKGRNTLYPNFIDTGGKQIPVFEKFVRAFSDEEKLRNVPCDMCGNGLEVDREKLDLNEGEKSDAEKFFNKIQKMKDSINSHLASSDSEFPNSFWNFSYSPKICHLCVFLLIHQHKAFTSLHKGLEIFINSPSFKVMYYLNEFFRKFANKEEKDLQKVFAMSLIEYQLKLQTTISKWSIMNLEIVKVKKKGEFQLFFEVIPHELMRILNDREVASLIKELERITGKSSILEVVLNGQYEKLNEISYHLLKAMLGNKNSKGYVEDYIKLDDKNDKGVNSARMVQIVSKISRLYSRLKAMEGSYAGRVR
jgi:CRISPR-associated protein Cst1